MGHHCHPKILIRDCYLFCVSICQTTLISIFELPIIVKPQKKKVMFSNADSDSDSDGSISSEESSLSSEMFSLLDTNEDGVISQDEIEAAQADKQEEMTMMEELSSNQTVSQDQAINVYHQVMESLMTNFSSTDYTDSNIGSFLQTMA